MATRKLLALVLVPCAIVAALAFAVPLSAWGVAYTVALALVAMGAATSRLRRGRLRGITRAGLLLFVLVPAGRLASAQRGRTTTTTLPSGRSRVPELLVDEQDVVVPAAHLLAITGRLRRSEVAGLPDLLAERYAAMRDAEGVTVSPVLGSYVLGQDEGAFDVVSVTPPAVAVPRVAVVFLHGFAGSFVLPCWQLAQAAREIGALTVCPSTDWQGRWGRGRRGAATLAATIRWLRGRGIERLYLAGLSNGAIGAGDLAPSFARQLAGLIVISGASRRAPPRGLPVLAVQGDADTMTRPALARAYARRAGRHGTYVELQGNHFVFLARHEEARTAIARWLRAHEAERSRRSGRAGAV